MAPRCEQAARAAGRNVSGGDQQAVARVRYNRGVLLGRHTSGSATASVFADAEADLREAVRLLEPLARQGSSSRLPGSQRGCTTTSAVSFSTRSGRRKPANGPGVDIIHEALTKQQPGNEAYAMELVKFDNNLADVLRELGDTAEATPEEWPRPRRH